MSIPWLLAPRSARLAEVELEAEVKRAEAQGAAIARTLRDAT